MMSLPKESCDDISKTLTIKKVWKKGVDVEKCLKYRDIIYVIFCSMVKNQTK